MNIVLLTRISAVVTCVLLLLAALDFGISYDLLRALLFSLFLVLALLSFKQHYKELALAYIASALLFNPFMPAHFPKNMWVVLDMLLIAGIAIATYWSTNPYQKGSRFERYVASRFPEEKFKLVDRTRDNGKFLGRSVESDGYPDLRFRNLKTGIEFAVECKWRRQWFKKTVHGESGIQWNIRWTERYSEYGNRENVQVFLAVGIGGTPDNPRELYIVPIDVMKWPFIKRSHLIGNNRPIN